MDLDDFYDGDPRRGESPEVRFGAHWLDEAGYAYAIAWLERTGELYAVRHVAWAQGLPPLVDPWAQFRLRHRQDRVEAEVFVLLVESSRQRIDSLLDGWAHQQGQSGGFEELVARLDEAGYPPPW